MANFVQKHALPVFRTEKIMTGRVSSGQNFARFMLCGKELSTQVDGKDTSEFTALCKAVEEAGGRVFSKKYEQYEQPEVALIIFPDGSCLAKNDPAWVSSQDFSIFGDNAERLHFIALQTALGSKGGLHIFKDNTGIPILTDENRNLTYLNLSEMKAGAHGITRIEVVDSTFNPETMGDFIRLRQAQLRGDTEVVDSYKYENQCAREAQNTGRYASRFPDYKKPKSILPGIHVPDHIPILAPGLNQSNGKGGGHAGDRLAKVEVTENFIRLYVDDPVKNNGGSRSERPFVHKDDFVFIAAPNVISYTAQQIRDSSQLFLGQSLSNRTSLERMFFVSSQYGDPPGVTKYWQYLMVRISNPDSINASTPKNSKYPMQPENTFSSIRVRDFSSASKSISSAFPFRNLHLSESRVVRSTSGQSDKSGLSAVSRASPQKPSPLFQMTGFNPSSGYFYHRHSASIRTNFISRVWLPAKRASSLPKKPHVLVYPRVRATALLKQKPSSSKVSAKSKKTAYSAKDKKGKAKKDEKSKKGGSQKKPVQSSKMSAKQAKFARFLAVSGIQKGKPKFKSKPKKPDGIKLQPKKDKKSSSRKEKKPVNQKSKSKKAAYSAKDRAGKTKKDKKSKKVGVQGKSKLTGTRKGKKKEKTVLIKGKSARLVSSKIQKPIQARIRQTRAVFSARSSPHSSKMKKKSSFAFV